MYRKILCPIDGSTASNKGVAEAINLANNQGAKLRFFHVIDQYVPVIDGVGSLPHVNVYDVLLKNAENVIEQAQSQAKKLGLDTEAKIAEILGGNPAKEIIKEAESWSADLIIMGTHGLRGFNRLVMGSDAENVVRTSAVPVLLLNAANHTV